MIKIKTDHNAFNPTFKQIAALLEDDFVMLRDSSNDDISMGFTVVHKNNNNWGFHVSTYLADRPEYSINVYYNLPVKLQSIRMKRTYKTERGRDGFPYLMEYQINQMKLDIENMKKDFFDQIEYLKKDIETGSYHLKIEDVFMAAEGGLDLRKLKTFGIKIDYEDFILLDHFKTYNQFTKVLDAIINSKDPFVKKLTEKYIEIIFERSKDFNLSSVINVLRTISKYDELHTPKIHNMFFEKVIKQFFTEDNQKNEDFFAMDSLLQSFENNYGDSTHNQIIDYYYSITKNTRFFRKELRSIFLI